MVKKYIAPQRRPVYIKEWLAAEDINQDELARRMKTDPANVTRWIKDPQRLTLDVLSGMADGLGIHVGDLFRKPEIAKARDNLVSSVSTLSHMKSKDLN